MANLAPIYEQASGLHWSSKLPRSQIASTGQPEIEHKKVVNSIWVQDKTASKKGDLPDACSDQRSAIEAAGGGVELMMRSKKRHKQRHSNFVSRSSEEHRLIITCLAYHSTPADMNKFDPVGSLDLSRLRRLPIEIHLVLQGSVINLVRELCVESTQ